eukprot:2907486-Pleurochrysis_carterae.AAC.1
MGLCVGADFPPYARANERVAHELLEPWLPPAPSARINLPLPPLVRTAAQTGAQGVARACARPDHAHTLPFLFFFSINAPIS